MTTNLKFEIFRIEKTILTIFKLGFHGARFQFRNFRCFGSRKWFLRSSNLVFTYLAWPYNKTVGQVSILKVLKFQVFRIQKMILMIFKLGFHLFSLVLQ